MLFSHPTHRRLRWGLGWMRRALILGLLLIGLSLSASAPASGVVTNCADDAQLSALLIGGGMITFNCGGVGAAATITVSSTKTIAGSVAVVIDGGGKITLSGGKARRVFNVSAGAALALTDLTIRDGRDFGGGGILNEGTLTIDQSTLTDNEAFGQFGGAIKNTGALTITNSTVVHNTATNGYGGGIDSAELQTLTVIVNSTFADNSAKLAGGAIANNGIVKISGSTFSNNTAGADYGGGAIENTGPLTVSTSTFSGNTAGKGGAIYNEGGSATINNSTLSGNVASSAPHTGGGIHNESGNAPGAVAVSGSTLFGNSAPNGAGGNLFNTTGNIVEIKWSIVATGVPANCAGVIASQGSNLDSSDSCGFTTVGDLRSTDPQLGSLTNNGGATLTHALLPGSPAIDSSNPAQCTDTMGTPIDADQRDAARPQDGDGDGTASCDIGAYEHQTSAPSPTATPPATPTPGDLSLRAYFPFVARGTSTQ